MWNHNNSCFGDLVFGGRAGCAAGKSCLVLAKLSMEFLLGGAALDCFM